MTKNKILALKYRPQEFKNLIGQEVMAQTITNAIKINKTPNAYLLTGIRGVGKTTTARLIAKALNCQKNFDEKIKCSNEKFCPTCEEIIGSNHIDILEIDAASKTGIDDIRELIENSRYSPTSAKYKIFIIDEVHMLSKQAFNGLLKTLEEPPPSLKFILATTEVRKIPVTILSRCQRFDLKRVSVEKLSKHLKNIALLENGKISDDAIKLIARTSEGSVRDAISLLDRALISQSIIEKNTIEENDVREMLGLADRTKILSLFKEILTGNEKEALEYLKGFINDGMDAKIFLNDILEILYFFSRRINLGPIEKDMSISETEVKLVDAYSKDIDMQDIGLFWQLTIKTIDDLRIIGNENLALEMYVMQLVHLKNIDNKKEILQENIIKDNVELKNNLDGKNIKDENLERDLSPKVKNQLKSTNQIKSSPIKDLLSKDYSSKIEITNFQDLINLANEEKEVELKFDLERNVKLVSFNKGKIDISFNENLNKNFIKNLTEKLLLWTGERWIISLSKNTEAKSVYEQNIEQESFKLSEFKKSGLALKIEEAFPDAKLKGIREDKND
ncbi:DNA polymerase III subunit gamma/tau [Pelagibacteraceae bacterium]|nr:DNA polymerase III subunit gamma/tau [Pelagibacteraceae bacterium]